MMPNVCEEQGLKHLWKSLWNRRPGSLTYSFVYCLRCGKPGWKNG